ncbi:MAG: DinB family protein [Mucilaginibacter sp.]
MKIKESVLCRLKSQHETIGELIFGADRVRLYKNPSLGKWNVHDNIAHLAKYQTLLVERMRRILHEENPSFSRYSAEDDIDWENWRRMDISTLIGQIETDRKEIFEFVTSLSEEQARRIGVHPKFGQLDILGWVEFFLLHEAHHLLTIFQLVHQSENL